MHPTGTSFVPVAKLLFFSALTPGMNVYVLEVLMGKDADVFEHARVSKGEKVVFSFSCSLV